MASADLTGEAGHPCVVDVDGYRVLHFDGATIQSRMDLAAPEALALDYTRAMMAFLLFAPAPDRIEMIGLGGGSLAKYCHRRLPSARIRVIEISAEVIALRERFGIPPDGERFSVLHADGADYVRDDESRADVLLVDGFDRHGLPPTLCSAEFYAHCRRRLDEGGVMAVNLWGGDPRYGLYVDRLRQCFERRVVFLPAGDGTNRIAFAWGGGDHPPARSRLLERARKLSGRFDFGALELARQLGDALEHGRRAPRRGAARE